MVEDESYHLPVAYHDDQPNSYDETIPHDSPESGEIPTPYHEPPALQPTTPSGTLGPGGFSPPDDPSEVAGLRDQVAAAGSSAAAANAAHNANFLVLAQSPGNPEIPGTPASENSLQGAATMAGYVQSQIGTPDSANPAAIAAGAATGLSTNVSGMIGGRADLCERFPDTCLANELVVQRYTPGDIAADQAGFGVWNALSIVVGFIPIVGSIQSVVEFGTGHDHIGGEPTSRWLAAGGIFAGVLPGGKGLLKGGSKAVTMVLRHADDVPAGQVVRAVAPNTGGRGLIGLVKPGGTVDDALRAYYVAIAQSPQMAAAVGRYNKIARFLGQKPSASIDDIAKALGDDVTFSKVGHIRSGVFEAGQHPGDTRFWLQGNPTTAYGQRVGRHELTHIGAALKGQGDTFLHEIAVQAATTPENLVFGVGSIVVIGGTVYWVSGQ